MNEHGFHATRGRPLYSEFVADFAALEDIRLPLGHTVLLLLVDARGIDRDLIARIAKRFLTAGLIYICVWGPDCERVHDIFDEVHVGNGTVVPNEPFMSAWHSDEPLEEAIWFFLQCAFPLDARMETTSYVAVTVGGTEWAANVAKALSDVDAFKARVLDDEFGSREDSPIDAPHNGGR